MLKSAGFWFSPEAAAEHIKLAMRKTGDVRRLKNGLASNSKQLRMMADGLDKIRKDFMLEG